MKPRGGDADEVAPFMTQGGEQRPGNSPRIIPGRPHSSGPKCTDPLGKGCTRPPRQEIAMPGSPHGAAPRPCASCTALVTHKRRREQRLPQIRTNAAMKARL